MDMHRCGGRLCVWSFGFALGIVKGLCLFVMGIAAWQWGWAPKLMDNLSEVYYGYGPTLLGSVYGAIEGFVAGFITGIILVGLYNLFRGYCCRACGCRSEACKTECLPTDKV